MSQSFRILHCLRAPVGGLFRHVTDLAREQTRRGHQVGVLCDARAADGLTRRRLDDLARHLTLGLTRVPMPREPGIGDVVGYRETLKNARRLRVDVIHGHGAKGGAYARLAGGRMKRQGANAPVVLYTPHGGSLHYNPSSLKGRLFMTAERWLAGKTDGLIFESRYSAHVYARQVGETGCPFRVIANGVGRDEFPQHAPNPQATDLLFIGELRRLKGVDLLLEAMAALRNDGRNLTAVIVGDGPDADAFKAQCVALGLEDRVRFAGAMPAAQAFPLGRILVMPSRAESFPYIVLEAAVAGIPLIATAVGGIPEITAGTPCRLVVPESSTELAKTIALVIAQPEDTQSTAMALQSRVREHFTIDAMTEAVLDFYACLRSERVHALSQPTLAPVVEA